MLKINHLEQLPALNVPGGVMHRLMGDNLTFMWGRRAKGSLTPKHSHPHEQIVWLVSGRIDCQIGEGPVQSFEAGTTILIPGGIEHELRYTEDCEIAEIFSPPRYDLFPSDKQK